MPREEHPADSPVHWLNRAKSNLSRAKHMRPDDVFWEDVCFDAQQACEKALKALLIKRKSPFRFIHDIGELLNALSTGGLDIPPAMFDAVELTEFAVEARYPGTYEPVSESEAAHAVALASRVLAWVEPQI